jgi:SM-20-related protein
MTAQLVSCEEFLAPTEASTLWRFAIDRKAQFVQSEVISGNSGRADNDYRRSRVLYELDSVRDLITDRVTHCLPQVLSRLGIAPFQISSVELQATVTNDGEWFKPHRDSGHDPVSSRQLTFVYYCHREPRGFSGGELRMFGPVAEGMEASATPAHDVSPTQNAIVFFPSNYLHEVTCVSCPSRRFEDGRLTFNGWLHR